MFIFCNPFKTEYPKEYLTSPIPQVQFEGREVESLNLDSQSNAPNDYSQIEKSSIHAHTESLKSLIIDTERMGLQNDDSFMSAQDSGWSLTYSPTFTINKQI